jgi:hypothetical protein
VTHSLFGVLVACGLLDQFGQATAQRSPDASNSQRSRNRDVGRQFVGLGAHLIEGHEMLSDSETTCLLAGDAATRVEQVGGDGLADESRERRADTEARMETEPGEVGGKSRLGCDNTDVGGESDAETGTDGGPMDRGDDRYRAREETHRLRVERVLV